MLDFQEHVFRKVRKMHHSGARKVCFEDLNKDMFLEVRVEKLVKY